MVLGDDAGLWVRGGGGSFPTPDRRYGSGWRGMEPEYV